MIDKAVQKKLSIINSLVLTVKNMKQTEKKAFHSYISSVLVTEVFFPNMKFLKKT